MCRGWISIENDGANENYYLNIKKWYFMLAPYYVKTDNSVILISVSTYGDISGAHIVNDNASSVLV